MTQQQRLPQQTPACLFVCLFVGSEGGTDVCMYVIDINLLISLYFSIILEDTIPHDDNLLDLPLFFGICNSQFYEIFCPKSSTHCLGKMSNKTTNYKDQKISQGRWQMADRTQNNSQHGLHAVPAASRLVSSLIFSGWKIRLFLGMPSGSVIGHRSSIGDWSLAKADGNLKLRC